MLLVIGLLMDELSWRGVGICLLLAVGAMAMCAAFNLNVAIFMVALGLIDVSLVLVIFKGDFEIR
ncbi:MAG: hypothetical protein ABI162_11125 [Luteolibacter sp.]